MKFRLGAGALAVILIVSVSGLVCCIAMHAQAPPAGKSVMSVSTSSSDDGSSGGVSSSNPKAKAKASPPDAGGSADVPQDSKASTPASMAGDSYVVGVADSLLISVWKEPDFSGPVVVRPDGVVTVPVVGDVHVAGLTTTQVQQLITEKLKGIVTEPQVTVVVRDIKSRKVYLMGKVGRVGAVPLLGHETVLQLLAESGGVEKFAKTKKIYILRTEGDHQKRIDFPYKKVLEGSAPDVELMVGDVIVVP